MSINHVIEKDTPIPLYYQLKTFLLEDIKSGTFAGNDMIPTEKELCEAYDISRTTVRQAITELVQEGYLYRIKSKGTFVTKPKAEKHILIENSCLEPDIENKEKVRLQVLRMETVSMPANMIEAGVGTQGDKTIYIRRVLLNEEKPFARIETYLSSQKFKHLTMEDLETDTLHSIMERSPDTKVTKITCSCEAIPAAEEDVSILKVQPKSAIHLFSAKCYNFDNELLEFSYIYFCGDRSKLHFEINNMN